MSAIGPGDWVECVDASPGRGSGMVSLVLGALYRVEDVFPARQGLTLVGRPAPPPSIDYAISRFRPVYRPRADLIETLLQPVDGVSPELEPA